MSIITCISLEGSALKSCAKKHRNTGTSLPVARLIPMATTPITVHAFRALASSAEALGSGLGFANLRRGFEYPSPRHALAMAPGRSAAGAR